MSVIRCLFLGTPDIAAYHLQALIEDEHFDVVGVISQPDRPRGRKMKLQPSPVKELAQNHKIPVLTPEKVKGEDVFDWIHQRQAEAAVVVAFGQILSTQFLELFPKKVVNVHASLLPLWRGAAPIQRSLMAGDKETGVSLQVMVKALDAGPVLGERRIDLDDSIDAIELHDKMKSLGAELLNIEFMDYLRGNLAPIPQDENLVTYAHKISKSESAIDWSKSAREIHNKVRGMKLGPGTYFVWKGKKVKVHKTQIEEMPSKGVFGQVLVSEPKQGLVVSCGDQALRFLELQMESKKRQKIEEFLLGYVIEPLTKLS